MTSYKNVQGIQHTDAKQKIRDHILSQAISFSQQTKSDIKLLSLPSTEWAFERQLIQVAQKHKIKAKIVGVENSSDAKTRKAFLKNVPVSFCKARFGNIDVLIKGLYDPNSPIYGYNVIWADYCGNPAAFFMFGANGKLRYNYPQFLTMRDVVAGAKGPLLYYMTFQCNGRIFGGAKKMMKAMSSQATTVPAAIRTKLSQTLAAYGLSEKATKIFDIYYHGTGISFMITVGIAINFKPKFYTVKEDWVKKDKENKKTDQAIGKHIVSQIDIAKEAMNVSKEVMKILSDKGWDKEKIAKALNVNPQSVQSVLAWHHNRNSWEKNK